MNNRVKLFLKFIYGREYLKYEELSFFSQMIIKFVEVWVLATPNKSKTYSYYKFTSDGEIIVDYNLSKIISLKDYINLVREVHRKQKL